MAKPVKYENHVISSAEEALKIVSFPVERKQVFFLNEKNEQIAVGRDVIYRPDNGFQFEVLSQEYEVVPHEQALRATLEALSQIDTSHILKTVGLERDGAKMLVRIQLNQPYEVAPGDIVKPELTLINSYDAGIAFGFDLGCERIKNESQSYAPNQASSYKWMHLGNKPNALKLINAANKALSLFKGPILIEYRSMAQSNLDQDLATKIVIQVIKSEFIPQKLGSIVLTKTLEHRELSFWELFNVCTHVICHDFEGSPTRKRELLQLVSSAFCDPLKRNKLVHAAEQVTKDDVLRWMEKIKDVA